ncbi:HXXEE domain-containing protein [Jiella endophytica]|uniref:HXXEE domain-containing protein n=1 Tax=Jiella endophytica TaxID=2558362 RepID=A0A4Y8RTT1_9HYPH|nr:HXXEE domain-containing protein [Jiella endophytica]TFF27739.1 HXXEE domain-containing protein [Jiella endophytica]
MFARLVAHWVYGGFLAGLLILALTPIIASEWTAALTLVFLQLPVYMVHQFEEHDDGRFAAAINAMIGKGRTVLDDAAVFAINVPGVWGVNLVSIWLAFGVGIGWGLIGVYLTLVNALAHIGQAIRLRAYNPGLATAIVLFLPVGIAGALIVGAVPGVGAGHHLAGLAVAIAIHAGIVAYVVTRRRRLA